MENKHHLRLVRRTAVSKGGTKGAFVVVVASHQKEQTVQLGAGNNFFTSLCFADQRPAFTLG